MSTQPRTRALHSLRTSTRVFACTWHPLGGLRRPPRIAVQVNDRRLIQRDWAYHLEDRLRENYGLQGVPRVIDYVPRKRDRGA